MVIYVDHFGRAIHRSQWWLLFSIDAFCVSMILGCIMLLIITWSLSGMLSGTVMLMALLSFLSIKVVSLIYLASSPDIYCRYYNGYYYA